MKRYNLGSFWNPEDAHAAYLVKAEELQGEYAVHNRSKV